MELPQPVKGTYQNPSAIILSGKRLKALSLRSETRQVCSPLSPPLFNTVLAVLARAIRQWGEKRHLNWKRSKTTSICR